MPRGLAVFIVILPHHSNIAFWADGYPGYGAGQFGVMLFFMLSGFLMSYLYMLKALGQEMVKRYAIVRGARVLP